MAGSEGGVFSPARSGTRIVDKTPKVVRELGAHQEGSETRYTPSIFSGGGPERRLYRFGKGFPIMTNMDLLAWFREVCAEEAGSVGA